VPRLYTTCWRVTLVTLVDFRFSFISHFVINYVVQYFYSILLCKKNPQKMCILGKTWLIQHDSAIRGRILGRNWDKKLKSFPPYYSQSLLLTDLVPPPLPILLKWFETDLQYTHCIQKPQAWELSRLCPEFSTKFYVYEFGFRVRQVQRPYVFIDLWRVPPVRLARLEADCNTLGGGKTGCWK
jgi:hypothetical protein